MTDWNFDPDQKSGVLSVEGELTIKNVSDLKERLVEAFAQAETVTIDVSATEAVDVAGVQLLCACHRFSGGRGKGMALHVGENRVLQEFLNDSGFSRSLVCSFGGESRCLWMDES